MDRCGWRDPRGVTRGVTGDRGFDLLQRLAVMLVRHQHPRPRHAGLAAVEKRIADSDLHGGRHVRAVEDHVGGFAAQLEGDLLDRAPGQFADPRSDAGGPGEGHKVDVRVRRKSSPMT